MSSIYLVIVSPGNTSLKNLKKVSFFAKLHVDILKTLMLVMLYCVFGGGGRTCMKQNCIVRESWHPQVQLQYPFSGKGGDGRSSFFAEVDNDKLQEHL